MAVLKKFTTKHHSKNFWAGLARQTIDFQHALGELVDNSLSATLPKTVGVGKQTGVIEITIEEKDTGDIRLQVADAGKGVSLGQLSTDDDNIFVIGYEPDERGFMNEHGFGLKNALALLTSGFVGEFLFLSKPAGTAEIYGVVGPISDEMEVNNFKKSDWEQDLKNLKAAPSGVKIRVDVKRDYFNSLYIRGQVFETLVDRFGEHLGVMYEKYIEKGNEIFLRYKSKGASNWTDKKIPAIPAPFLKTSEVNVTTDKVEIEVDGKNYSAEYLHGRLDTKVKQDAGLGWPYPIRMHYQGSNARCGVTISSREKILKTGVFREIWPDKSGDVSFNNFLAELRLGPEFRTTNSKSDLDPHSEIWQRLIEKLQKDFEPEKTTKRTSEENLRKKLIEMFASVHHLKGKDKPKHLPVWDGGGEIDIWFELGSQSVCVETKVEDALVRDVYQLEMYWDGLVESGKKIKEAILVANDFSANVLSAIKYVNTKKDKKGTKYKIIPKKISDYPLS
jgi:hypothetical protein